MNIAFVPLYIRYLGIESYGLLGLYAIMQAWFGLLDMGLLPALAREMSRINTGKEKEVLALRDTLRSIEWLVLVFAIVASGCIFAASWWISTEWLQSNQLPIADVQNAICLMGIVAATRFMEGIYRSSLAGMQRQVVFNVLSSILATIRGFGAIAVLAFMSSTIQAFFLWQITISFLSLATLAWATYSYLPPAERSGHFSLKALREISSFAGGMVGIAFLSLLLTQSDKILLSKLLSLSDLGYYSFSAVAASSLSVFVGPITQAWYPRLVQLHSSDNPNELALTYHQGAQLVSVLLGSASLVLILFSQLILELWTQDIELAKKASPLLSILAFGNLLHSTMYFPYYAQLAHGFTGLTIRMNLILVMFVVPAILVLTPRYGVLGAAYIWMFLNCGYFFIGSHFFYMKVMPHEKWNWYLYDVLLPLTGCALVLVTLKSALSPPDEVFSQITYLALISFSAILAASICAKHVRSRVISVLEATCLRFSQSLRS